MSQHTTPDETAELLTRQGFAFTPDPPIVPHDSLAPGDDEEGQEDLEFQPRQRRRLHWLTVTLIGLVIWGVGFLVGVLVDRAVSSLLG